MSENKVSINIQTIEGGDSYIYPGCGIDTYYREITEDEYKRVTVIEGWRGILNAEYEANMSDAIRYGYGFYGCGVCESNGKYYYYTKTGNSCD